MKRWSMVLLVLATGCGAAGPYDAQAVASTDEPKRSLDGYEERLTQLQAELDATMPAASQPSELRGDLPVDTSRECLVAADLRDRICDLSERICRIAESEHEASGLHERCTRARAACASARSRVAAACGEL